jgi:hypothetical protein
LKLSRKDIVRPGKKRIQVTDAAYKQVFQPYIDSRGSLFITSDSAPAAWRVLFEESVRRYETRRAEFVPRVLRGMLANLPRVVREVRNQEDASVRKARPGAERRARPVIGVALRLDMAAEGRVWQAKYQYRGAR